MSRRGQGSGRVLLAVIATSTAGVLPMFLVGGLAVQIRADLDFSPAAQGWLVSAYFLVSAVASAPLGGLVERLGPAKAMRIAAAGAAGVLLLGSSAPTFAVLLGALMLGGTVNALAQPASNALVVAGVPSTRNGLAFGVKQSAIPAATLLAGLAVPAVALTVGWRWAFVGAAAGALAASVLVPDVDGSYAPERVAGAPRSETSLRPLVVLGLGAGVGAAMATSLGAFLTSSAVAAGLGPGVAGWLLSLGSLVGLSSRLVMGWQADSRSGGHFRVVVVMLLAGSLGLAGLATGVGPIFVVATVLAFGAGWAWPGVFVLAVVDYNRSTPAAATGLTQVGTYGLGAFGPPLFGALVDGSGYPTAWLAFAALALTAAGVIQVGSRLIEADRKARTALA